MPGLLKPKQIENKTSNHCNVYFLNVGKITKTLKT